LLHLNLLLLYPKPWVCHGEENSEYTDKVSVSSETRCLLSFLAYWLGIHGTFIFSLDEMRCLGFRGEFCVEVHWIMILPIRFVAQTFWTQMLLISNKGLSCDQLLITFMKVDINHTHSKFS
jgi:hypothetical protein